MTSVPAPSFGPTGFSIPTEAAILAGVQTDINAAFGGALNFTNQESPQGQLAASFAAIVGFVNDTFLFFTNQTDPAFATGRMQDAIGRLSFITRNPATSATISVTCSGLSNTPIPAGSLVRDGSGNIFASLGAVTIPAGGSVANTFVAQIPGLLSVPAAVTIYQTIPGWDSVTVISGSAGTDTESSTAFEERRQQTIAANSNGSIPSVLGALLGNTLAGQQAVPGVTDAYVRDNASSSPVTVLGQVLAPTSLYACVLGGTNADVARAIWTKKMPGCAYTGNTTVAVQDTNSGYQPPLPSYNVTFQRPTALRILYAINIVASPQVPANAAQLIQAAIASAFAGGDGGPRARIGSQIFATRFAGAIMALGAWVQLRTIQLGSANTQSAAFTASIAAGVMTVTAVSAGALGANQTLIDQTGAVAPGTTIINQTSGPAGGTGNYNVSIAQTVGSEAMTSAVPTLSSVQVQINQNPTVVAADIAVTAT